MSCTYLICEYRNCRITNEYRSEYRKNYFILFVRQLPTQYSLLSNFFPPSHYLFLYLSPSLLNSLSLSFPISLCLCWSCMVSTGSNVALLCIHEKRRQHESNCAQCHYLYSNRQRGIEREREREKGQQKRDLHLFTLVANRIFDIYELLAKSNRSSSMSPCRAHKALPHSLHPTVQQLCPLCAHS